MVSKGWKVKGFVFVAHNDGFDVVKLVPGTVVVVAVGPGAMVRLPMGPVEFKLEGGGSPLEGAGLPLMVLIGLAEEEGVVTLGKLGMEVPAIVLVLVKIPVLIGMPVLIGTPVLIGIPVLNIPLGVVVALLLGNPELDGGTVYVIVVMLTFEMEMVNISVVVVVVVKFCPGIVVV